MPAGTSVQIVGNLTQDPELRFTQGGTPVANLNVAVNTRVKQGDQWVDGEPSFYRVTVWRELAEHVKDSLEKGMSVIILGRMQARTWETQDGEKRTAYEVTAEEIGPSLRWATAQVTKARAGGSRRDAGDFNDEPPF